MPSLENSRERGLTVHTQVGKLFPGCFVGIEEVSISVRVERRGDKNGVSRKGILEKCCDEEEVVVVGRHNYGELSKRQLAKAAVGGKFVQTKGLITWAMLDKNRIFHRRPVKPIRVHIHTSDWLTFAMRQFIPPYRSNIAFQ